MLLNDVSHSWESPAFSPSSLGDQVREVRGPGGRTHCLFVFLKRATWILRVGTPALSGPSSNPEAGSLLASVCSKPRVGVPPGPPPHMTPSISAVKQWLNCRLQ